MPYIDNTRRTKLDRSIDGLIDVVQQLNLADKEKLAGDLNYVITRLLDGTVQNKRYRDINESIGILECAKMEFYRRVAAPYEDQKAFDEGDVYGYEQPKNTYAGMPNIDKSDSSTTEDALNSSVNSMNDLVEALIRGSDAKLLEMLSNFSGFKRPNK